MSAPDKKKEPEYEKDTVSDTSSRDGERSESKEYDTGSLYTLKTELTDYVGRRTSSLCHEVYPGTERMDYDFVLERRNVNSTNIFESISHLIKGVLGAGILSIHEGYMRGGLWASLGATVVIGAIVPYSMYMLSSSAHKLYVTLRVPRLSYPDLVEAAVATGPIRWCRKFSKAFRHSVEVFVFTAMCGTCCIYQIMMADTLKQVLEAVSETIEDWNLTIRIYILVLLIPLFFVCMIRNLKYLAPFSIVADLFVAICILTAMYYSVSEAGNVMDRPGYKSFIGLVQFCGILLYSIDGVAITMPIENNMANPQYFPIVLQCGMVIVIVAVTFTGFFGYWGYGESCRSPITIQMPLQTVPIIMEFLLVAILTVTFAINFWVPFRIIWHYVGRRHRKQRGEWERVYRTLLVTIITCLSLAYPNMIRLMIFLGNFFLAIIALIYPAFVEILVTWRDHLGYSIRWRLIKNLIIIMLGIMLSICAFIAV